MKILISNDDGIDSLGLKALVAAFAENGDEVFVAAPKSEQSGMAHAMTVHRPIEFAEREDFIPLGAKKAYFVDGTPADCVKSFLEFLSDEKINAVVSGINNGANLATDVVYSGTVGAALEGFLHDIPAFAVSIDVASTIPLNAAAKEAATFVAKQMQKGGAPTLLNINFPKAYQNDRPQYKATRLARRDYKNAYVFHTNNTGRKWLSVQGEIVDSQKGEGTDVFAVEHGFIAVTRLLSDVSDHDFADGDIIV